MLLRALTYHRLVLTLLNTRPTKVNEQNDVNQAEAHIEPDQIDVTMMMQLTDM